MLIHNKKKFVLHTVAFYNFENLFDTINNPNNDEEWLPNGAQTGHQKSTIKIRESFSCFV